MNSIYHQTSIGDVCDVGDGVHAIVKRRASGVPYLTSKNIGDGRLDLSRVDCISKDDYERLLPNNSTSTRRPQPGDVLIGIIGTFGNAYRYRVKDHFAVSSAVALLRPNKTVLDSDYLFYCVRSNYFRDAHLATRGGSAQGYTNIPTVKSLPIILPPLPIQRRIAEILGRLDDKIEINRRINRTLEAMAQALYKHWFVDFGPFQAGEFVESELGPIPKGWEVGKLGDIARTVKEPVNPQSLELGVPYIGLADMPQATIALEAWGTSQDSTSGKFQMHRGQILFGKLRPYFKKVGVAPIDGICSTDILVIEAMNPAHYGLVLTQLTQDDFIDFTEAVSSGTRMPRVNWTMMARYPMVLPTKAVAEEYDKLVRRWIEAVLERIPENRQLVTIRDYLLPKLLSGEVPVEVAEELAA